VLLISPERLNNPDFRDSVLPKLAGTTGLLVVDDLVDSGWTMALAARLPRRAGAPAVLPLALAITT
jgi:ATP-dependent DNA helicase RecQ